MIDVRLEGCQHGLIPLLRQVFVDELLDEPASDVNPDVAATDLQGLEPQRGPRHQREHRGAGQEDGQGDGNDDGPAERHRGQADPALLRRRRVVIACAFRHRGTSASHRCDGAGLRVGRRLRATCSVDGVLGTGSVPGALSAPLSAFPGVVDRDFRHTDALDLLDAVGDILHEARLPRHHSDLVFFSRRLRSCRRRACRGRECRSYRRPSANRRQLQGRNCRESPISSTRILFAASSGTHLLRVPLPGASNAGPGRDPPTPRA
mmetsp:Transcript_87198/g.281649  ORF Transcript_87198/g.281649 Transcript_87198/m.281649 type:complete len:263 (-) Transcript_87198:2-790(-)